jgi:RimJ/RimL family protein N-acetyltransferase
MRPFDYAGPIETERLRLRAITPEDLDAVYGYQSREDVTRWLYWGPRTREEVRASLDLKIASTAIREEGDVLTLGAELIQTGALVGDFILRLVSKEHETAEIGYIIHPDHTGHGYATEAGRELLRLAFVEVGLHRVVGHTEPRNVGSARILEKLGMRREAYFVDNEFVKGEWQSEFVFAILEREWRAAHGS